MAVGRQRYIDNPGVLQVLIDFYTSSTDGHRRETCVGSADDVILKEECVGLNLERQAGVLPFYRSVDLDSFLVLQVGVADIVIAVEGVVQEVTVTLRNRRGSRAVTGTNG